VNEQTAGQVEAFAIDAASGAPTHLDDVSSGGNGPAHVSIDATGAWVLAANYGDGTVAVLPVAADGSLGAATATRTAGANAHEIVAVAADRFVLVPCLGADYVAQYTFDAQKGTLAPNAVPTWNAPAGTGPRHLAMHPSGAFAYVIGETASTMTALAFDAQLGRLTSLQTLSTRAAGVTGTNTGAAVAVHPSGKFLYGSNRGDDNIALFSIDASGHLTLVGHTPSGGQTPRDFTIDPTGAYLLVANQGSNNVVVFAIDAQTGALTPIGTPVSAPMPSFVGVVTLPG
jgi:6-phosphogluconolactonase